MMKKWFPLDTAALIFPAVMNKKWCNVFRLAVTLTEQVDPSVLQQAVNELAPRFPTFYVSLSAGMFWYHLKALQKPPRVQEDYAYPLSHMSREELRRCALRVFYYKNRIAVEFFHSLSDGTGGSVFLNSLVAHYLKLKSGIEPVYHEKLLDPLEPPKPEEMEDSFFKYSPEYGARPLKEPTVYRLHGTRFQNGYKRIITGTVDTDVLLILAHRYDVSVTVFLAAVMAESILSLQQRERSAKRWRPVAITVPVNLRRLFPSHTLRNFVLTLNVGVDPRIWTHSLSDLCVAIRHQLYARATPAFMSGQIGGTVLPQKLLPTRLAPLAIKSLMLSLVYAFTGERKGCINVSNLGKAVMGEEYSRWISSMDFIIGPQLRYPNNCSVISFGRITRINMISAIRETELEQVFFSRLVELGLPVAIESNDAEDR